jgi:hypothetical protein
MPYFIGRPTLVKGNRGVERSPMLRVTGLVFFRVFVWFEKGQAGRLFFGLLFRTTACLRRFFFKSLKTYKDSGSIHPESWR